MRYNANGTLDADPVTGFGAAHTGKVTTSIGSMNDEAFALAIQPDGKILVAGSSYNGNDYDFALVRYKADGTLDADPVTGFGAAHTGKVTTSIGSINDYANALGIQPDGRIVVAGRSYNGTKYDFALVRYNADGTLDADPVTGFGAAHTGKVTTSIGSGSIYDYAYALGIQPDGRIVVAGYSYNGTKYDFALVRYNADGTLDADTVTGFGAAHTGIVTTSIGSGYDAAHALGIHDGKIVVAGSSSNGNKYNFALIRYNADGTLDADTVTGFGAAHTGIVITPIGSGFDSAYALGIDTDGRIVAAGYSDNGSNVAAGYSDNGSNYDFALVRYNANGTLDSTFGNSGMVTTPIGSDDDKAFALSIQSTGEIVVAGSSFNITSNKYDFALAKYWPSEIP